LELLTGWRQHYTLVDALKQRHAQFSFKCPHLPTDRTRRKIKLCRGLT
jgi:hypothetical protein